jgi:glucokinase
MMLLAADIGGTNARFALCSGREHDVVASETYRTEAWQSAEEAVAEFLSRHPARVSAACFAVAGPVRDGRSEPINLRWTVEERRLSDLLGTTAVAVVNDLEANARGIPLLGERDFAVVSAGAPGASGNRAVVSAGTGLGEAALMWDGARYRALAGEGGHSDFAPRSEIEMELYRYLATDYGHVSYERLCSGGGLVNIYRFLRDAETRAPRWLEDRSTLPSAAAISAEAAADPKSLSARALTLFCSIYGARAANVALAFMATGGVYLGGGIAPRIARALMDGTFMRAFTAKGRLSGLLEQVPVRIVLNDRAALLGAAEIASELADDGDLGGTVVALSA